MKIRPVGAELFHADRRTDGQTDVLKLTVAFHNFAKAHKNTVFVNRQFSAGSHSRENHLLASSYPSVRPSMLTYQGVSHPTDLRDIGDCIENLSRKSKFG